MCPMATESPPVMTGVANIIKRPHPADNRILVGRGQGILAPGSLQQSLAGARGRVRGRG